MDLIERIRENASRCVSDQSSAALTGLVVATGDSFECTLQFLGGRLVSLEPRAASSEYEIALRGTDASWTAVLCGKVTLYEALSQLHGTIELDGSFLFAMQNLAALDRVLRAESDRAMEGPASDFCARIGDIEGRYVVVNGAPVYYETLGHGTPTIVCIHTAGRDSRQWHWFMGALADEYRVVALDLPGHHKSWPATGSGALESIAGLADLVMDFCAAIGVNEPIVVGCSVGASVCLYLAASRPQSLKAAIVMQAAEWTPTVSEAVLSHLDHPGVGIAHYLLGWSVSLIGSRTRPERRRFLAWCARQTQAACSVADLRAYSSFDIRGSLSAIACPLLIIHGEDDWIVKSSMASELYEHTSSVAMSSTEFESVPGAGHFVHVEQPEIVARAVRSFLRRRASAGRGQFDGSSV